MELGCPHRGGRCRPGRTRFSSPVCLLFRYIWNDPWTGDETLSSPGGAGSITYEPQPIGDRPVGGIGDFHTVRGGIDPGDISVFVPGLSELYICEWIMILGMDPIVPKRRLLLCTISGQWAISNQAKRSYQEFYVHMFVKNSIEPEILNYQILRSVLSRTTHIPSTRREWSTATSSSIIITAFEELNDEGSDTVFHA